MKTRRPAILAVFSLALALGATNTALAAVVFKKGNWQLDDSLPSDAAKGVCQASTAGKMGKAVVTLTLVVDKTGQKPLEVFLMPTTPSVGATAMFAQTKSGATFYQALLPRTGANDVYWNIPTNTQQLISDLKAGSQLNFRAVAGSREQLPLSLSGSTATIDEMLKRCTKSAVFTVQDFEAAFLPENADRFDINRITPDKAKQLRDLVATGATAFVKVRSVQKELEALDAKFAALVKERGTLQTDIDNLRHVQIPNMENQKAGAQTKIDTALGEIADFEARLPGKQSELDRARAAAADADARLRPLVPEHNRLAGLIRGAQSRLDSARANLSSIRDGVERARADISALNNEADRLSRDLPSLQDEVRRGERGLDDARRDQRAFDAQREIRERLQNDSRVDRLRREIRQGEEKVRQARDRAQDAQNDVNRAKDALRQCRGSGDPFAGEITGRILAGDSAIDKLRDGIDGARRGEECRRRGGENCDRDDNDNDDDRKPPKPGFPGHPGHPGNPGHPNPPPSPPPPPAPDCSAQEAALQNAKRAFDQAKDRLEDEQRDLRRDQNTLEAIRNEIENDVRRIENRLAERVNEWENFLSRARSDLGRVQDRLDTIVRFELPRLQNELNQLEGRLSNAIAEENSAESALDSARWNLESYDRRVDFDNISDAANRAASLLRQIESELSSLQRGISSRRALITEQTTLRDSLEKKISDALTLAAQKETRLGVVNGALTEYDAQKAEIQTRIDAALAELKAESENYAGVLLN